MLSEKEFDSVLWIVDSVNFAAKEDKVLLVIKSNLNLLTEHFKTDCFCFLRY